MEVGKEKAKTRLAKYCRLFLFLSPFILYFSSTFLVQFSLVVSSSTHVWAVEKEREREMRLNVLVFLHIKMFYAFSINGILCFGRSELNRFACMQYMYVVLMQSIRHGHVDVGRISMELLEMLDSHKSVGASL